MSASSFLSLRAGGRIMARNMPYSPTDSALSRPGVSRLPTATPNRCPPPSREWPRSSRRRCRPGPRGPPLRNGQGEDFVRYVIAHQQPLPNGRGGRKFLAERMTSKIARVQHHKGRLQIARARRHRAESRIRPPRRSKEAGQPCLNSAEARAARRDAQREGNGKIAQHDGQAVPRAARGIPPGSVSIGRSSLFLLCPLVFILQ